MPVLKNLKRERFVHELLEGSKRGWNAAEAYRRVYGKGGHVAESAASRLLKDVEVQARIAELSAPAARKVRVTVESLLAELDATVQAAREARQFGAVNGSLALIGKLTGLLRDRLEVGSPGEFEACKTADDVLDVLLADQAPAEALAMLDGFRELIVARAADGAHVVSGSPARIEHWQRNMRPK